MKITIPKAIEYITMCIQAQVSVMLTSSPGVGKSAIYNQIAKSYGLKLIDLRLSTIDVVELSGFPDKHKNKARWLPMDIFPLEDTPIPEGYHGWLLLMDEFNSASMAHQAASYSIMLDHRVGNHKLHPNVAVVAAGNLMTDNAIVNRLGTAMQSRMAHLELMVDVPTWLTWAMQNGIDYRISAYINRVPSNLHNFNPKHHDKTFSCPRTLEFMSKLITNVPTDKLRDKLPLLAGTVGKGVATEFVNDASVYSNLPEYPEILKNPLTARISKDPAGLFGAAYMVAGLAVKDDMDEVMQYVDRLPLEYGTICLQRLLERDKSILKHKEVMRWYKTNAIETF